MLVNCDIGERGADHPVDHKLMKMIGMANIACGAHAGDRESIEAFCAIAKQTNVDIAAHISYPDRKNFGRISMEISLDDLKESLTQQLKLMREFYPVNRVKLHGALYNDCNINEELAGFLAKWMNDNGITSVVTPFDSALADASRSLGLTVRAEAFAERRYSRDLKSGRLVLVNRAKDYASIHDLDLAVAHSAQILNEGKVELFIDTESGDVEKQIADIEAETICIHSDSPIALQLAEKLSLLK